MSAQVSIIDLIRMPNSLVDKAPKEAFVGKTLCNCSVPYEECRLVREVVQASRCLLILYLR